MVIHDLADLQCVECRSPELQWSGVPGTKAEAAVRCRVCGMQYPFEEAVLRMVPQNSPLRQVGSRTQEALAIDDGLQAEYWDDDNHGFRKPDHPIVRYFAEQRWNYLATKFDLGSVRTALDVGCGDGFSTMYAPSHLTMTACDGSLTMLRRHRGARRFQADAFQLPFRDGAFDLVFAWELLHHVSEPRQVLKEMARVSRRFVVCCEPNPLNIAQYLFAWYDPAHRWVLRFSRRYMVGEAEAAGLRVTSFTRGGCLFPNRTPAWLFPALKQVPYRLPLIGISNCLIGERPAEPAKLPDHHSGQGLAGPHTGTARREKQRTAAQRRVA